MNSPTGSGAPPPADGGTGADRRERARRQLAAARGRFEGTWGEAFVKQLKTVRAVEWTTIFGAELLWSVLPLLILLSSLASTRIDDDLSRHIGLNSHGAHIVEGLFRSSPAHDVIAILTGLIFALVGTVSVVESVQVLYERAFDEEHSWRRDLPRVVVWIVVLLVVLVAQAAMDHPVRSSVGPVVQVLVRFVMAMIFFWWTMHFLLAGRVPWRVLIRPAVVTASLWIALALFSSVYFSSLLTSDSKQFGTIGVVFTFLSWFILIGGVSCSAPPVGRCGNREVASARRSPVPGTLRAGATEAATTHAYRPRPQSVRQHRQHSRSAEWVAGLRAIQDGHGWARGTYPSAGRSAGGWMGARCERTRR